MKRSDRMGAMISYTLLATGFYGRRTDLGAVIYLKY